MVSRNNAKATVAIHSHGYIGPHSPPCADAPAAVFQFLSRFEGQHLVSGIFSFLYLKYLLQLSGVV